MKAKIISLIFPSVLLLLALGASNTWTVSAVRAVSEPVALDDLRITEIMYHPLTDTVKVSADYEFIELTHFGGAALDISGVSFSNGITYTFAAGTMIGANESLVIAADPVTFAARYGFAADNRAGYLGQLSNEGEEIALVDSTGNILFSVKYDNDEPLLTAAEGLGFSLVPTDPNKTPSVRGDWRVSSQFNGSPGQVLPPAAIPDIRVNEVLAHTDLPQTDFIELYNATNATADISGWLITDDLEATTKFVIPDGTTIPVYGYLVVEQDQLGFAFNSEGDSAFVLSRNAQGALTGHVHGFTFEPSPNGISLGRCTIADGNGAIDEEKFVIQNATTSGANNSLPQVGPIVISEIMYNGVTSDEFVELTNLSSNPVPLYDPSSPANTWRLRGVGLYSFPTNQSIPANGTALIVSSDPVLFRSTYNIPNTIAVYGPYIGRLNNDGERIKLERPDEQNADGTVPYYEVDGVRYNDATPWPTAADGTGKSLERARLSEFGNSVLNWIASEASGGTPGELSPAQQGSSSGGMPTVYLPIMSKEQGLTAATLMPQENPCFSDL